MCTRTTCKRSSLVVGVLVLVAVLSTKWIRVNVSPSVPYGLYRLAALPAPLPRGTLVVLPVPVSVLPWHSRWVPLLKPVAAVAGDDVCVQDGALWMRGEWYGPVYDEVGGRVLPQLAGCHTVAAGEVFLASKEPRSLDARYFGMVPVAMITAQAVPLFTWRY